MGKLQFEGLVKADFDDRTLAHLQFVIGQKLQRGETFFFSWKDDLSIGDGRSTVWLHPASVLYFKFYGSRTPPLNRDWLEALIFTANSSRGLYIVPEPTPSHTKQVPIEAH